MEFYKYTPALYKPEMIEKTLVGRDIELDEIKSTVSAAASGRSFAHPILIGPRGIGKSHILRFIYYGIRGEIKGKGFDVYKDKFVPIIFAEEEYTRDISKFLSLALDYIEGAKLKGLPAPPKKREKEYLISYMKDFKKNTGKVLLLLIENFNEIIDKFTEEDQSSLRELLMTSDSVLLISTVPTLFDSIINHEKPLYNFFHCIWLGDLDFENMIALLKKFAVADGREGFDKKIEGSEPKLRAIYELTGGNPRLILSLYYIMGEGDINSIEKAFLNILDSLSAYFRERMGDIPYQQREIIDAMAKAGTLLTPTEIAAKSDIPVNVVISQLKRLEKHGYVKKNQAKKGKKVFYDFKERLFSLWREMRVEAGRKRFGFIVRFLEVWYTKDELLSYLDKTLQEIHDKSSFNVDETELAINRFCYLKEAIQDFKDKTEASVAFSRGNYNAALTFFNRELNVKSDNAKTMVSRGVCHFFLKNFGEAIESYKKALEIKPDFAWAWRSLGAVYADLKRYDEAIESLKKALEIEPDFAWAWRSLGAVYADLKRYDEAIESYKKALEIKPDFAWAWRSLGNTYADLKRYDEAIESYKKALEIKPDYAMYLYGLIYELELKKGNFIGASETLKKVLILYRDIQEKDKEDAFVFFAEAFKGLAQQKRADLIRVTLQGIKDAGEKKLIEFLSPFDKFIEYLDTGEIEIIERLRSAERKVVEQMLDMMGQNPMAKK